MEISQFLTESYEFTRETLINRWSRLVLFILLNLPMLILNQLIDVEKIFDGRMFHWDAIPLSEAIPVFIVGTILSFFISGYIVRLLRGGDTPPEFVNWTALALDGIKLNIIMLIWIIPFIILGLVFFMISFGGMGFIIQMILLLLILVLIDLVVLIFFFLFGIIGVIRFARTGRIRDAFDIKEIINKIGRIGWGDYICALIILFVIRGVFSAMSRLLSFIPVIGIVIPYVIGPFLTVFQSRFIVHVYDNNEATQDSGIQ